MSAVDLQPTNRHRGGRAGFAVSTGTVIVAAVALVAGGTAFAYFSHQGSSQSHATVDGPLVVSTDVVTPSGTVLYPGGKGAFTIRVLSSTHPFRITDIAQDPLRSVVVTGGGPNCLGSSVTLIAQHMLTLDVHGTAVNKTYANAVSMSAAASNDCQGASFAIPVVLTGRSL